MMREPEDGPELNKSVTPSRNGVGSMLPYRTLSGGPTGPLRRRTSVGPDIRSTFLACAFLTTLAVCGSSSLRAQLNPAPPPPGFELQEFWSGLGPALSGTAPGLVPGEIYVASNSRVEVHDAQGLVRIEFVLNANQDFSIFERRGNTLLWADFNNSQLHLRDLTTGLSTTRQLPANTFALEQIGNGPILVSAAPGFPGNLDTEIHEIRPSGASRVLGSFPGPSGPLCIDPATGDLFYAEQSASFPSPPGSLSILRLPAATLQQALAGTRQFTRADATVFASGFDGIYDMCIDDRGRLMLTDPQNGGVVQLTENGGRLRDLLPRDPSAPTLYLSFVDGDAATLDPHQPSTGGVLWIGLTNFTSGASVSALSTEPPRLSAGNGPTLLPGQRTDLLCEGLTPLGIATFALAPFPHVPLQNLLPAPDGAPLWTATDLSVPPLIVLAPVDATGTARFDVRYPGGINTQLYLEAFGLDPTGRSVATSNPFVWTIQP